MVDQDQFSPASRRGQDLPGYQDRSNDHGDVFSTMRRSDEDSRCSYGPSNRVYIEPQAPTYRRTSNKRNPPHESFRDDSAGTPPSANGLSAARWL